ncbi:hypothetical protein AGDE_14510 [Angomonas deanei]|nr:hypothetical protein AGDE_14510 [Angomonas deanei]|eukprot:EPY20713.1 hypothetical protein AGDE_14510 [Angomonas deanei]
MLVACLLFVQTVAVVSAVEEDYPSGSLESIGLFASPEVGVRDVEDWQIFSEMNILPGAFCKDEFFNLLYAAMDVVVVFQPQFSTETNQTLLGFVRNVSLGNRYATDCFFKSAEELYMSTIPQKQSDKYSEEEALTIVFAVFNRVSGTFLRFENYSMNFPVFTPLQETTTTDSGSESTLSDSSPQSSGEASSSSGSSSSSQSEASSASGSGSDTSSSGEGSDSGEQNSGLYNYLGKPVTGSNSRILCLFPYRFGQYVSLYYGSKTGTSRLQISSANTPFSTIREFYKRQENSTNLYILGFYSVEELSVDTFDIIVVVDDNIPENTPDIPIPVNPPEEGSVPSDIKAYYSYAAVYREALLTVCAACVPITFLATEDNAGVVMLLKDQQEQSIRVAFLPYVAGAGVVPGDSSTSEPSYGPIPPITMVTLFDDIRTITTFVEDYVTGGLYITATCSLQCSVVARVQRDGSTLYDPTVKIVWPIGVQKGTKFSSLLIDDSTRTISYITPCSGSLCIYEVALFGIEQPVTNLDVHRSTNMTVTGFGFTKDMLCVFPDAGVTTTAYVTNTTSLLCSVPLMGNLSCSEHPFRLKVDGVSGYSGKDVVAGMGYVSQFSTPRVFSVTNNITGGSYGSLEAATLTVEGYGFLSPTIAQKQTCRLNTNSSEGMEDQTVYMPARYISQSRIECDLPALPHLLPSPVYVEVAIDNVTFSYVREEYVTYGTPETIFSVVENQTLGYVSTIRADTLVAIPPVVVYLIDSVGHYLTVTQDAKYEAVIIRASVLSVETNQSFDERQKESILVGTTQMSMTAGGSVTFSNLNFSCPPQGQIVLLFTVINPGTIPSLKDKTCVKVVIVEEGSPHHLSFSTPPSATVTPTVGLLKQQPVIGVCDVCNNTFRSIELGQIGNLNVTVEREAPEKNVTFLVDPTNNMFYAEGIEIKGVHGKSYLVSFKATIGDYPELVSSPILVTECDRSELAVMSNSSCLPCPLHAVCDGSHIVLAEEGWWRTGPNTFTFMECYPPQGVNACLSNGSCAVGYGGVRCSECLAGYRAANGECQKCPNAATSDFLSFLIILFFVVFLTVWIHLMTVLDPQSPHVGSVKGVINVIQLLGLFSLIRVKWPRVLFNFLQGLHNMTNLLDYVLTCTYDKHTGYIILLFIAPVGFVMVSTLVVRFLAVGLRRGRIDPAPMAAMLMVSYTHRRRRKMVEILDRIISSYKAHALPNESVEAYVDRMSHPSISTIAPRSFRFLSALVQTNSVVGNSASRLDNVSSHSHNRTSTQPERQSADGPNRPRLVATALPSTTTQFEDILIQCFESASGATEGDRIVYLLANQDTTVLRAVSEMQLVLPTKAVMADWVRTSRENESPALGRRAKASTEEALHRKYIKSTIQELPARVGHGVEESYRYQAIMQFRKSWIGILLNSIATVTFVFQFVFVATALTWQNCETLVEDGSVVTKYYTYHSTLQCDDPRYKPLRSAGIALLILYGVVLPLILYLFPSYTGDDMVPTSCMRRSRCSTLTHERVYSGPSSTTFLKSYSAVWASFWGTHR